MAGLGSMIGGIAGAAGSIIGSQTQAGGQEQAAQTQAQMFNKIVSQEQPFIQSGYGAVNYLDYLLGIPGGSTGGGQPGKGGQMAVGPFFSPTGGTGGAGGAGGATSYGLPAGFLTQTFSPTDFLNSPQYQFQMQQGGQATRNADTPGLGALSGAALKDLTNFNQGLASTYYGNYFNMFQEQQNNIFNRLSGIATLGQNAAGNLGTQGAALGTGIAGAQAGASASLGAGYSSAFNNLGNSAMLYNILGSQGGNSFNSDWGWTGGSPSNPDSYLSDRRLKEDIKPVGRLENGLTVYSYRMKGEQKFQVGLMSDEVEKINPDAVSTNEEGFKMVNYGKAVQ